MSLENQFGNEKIVEGGLEIPKTGTAEIVAYNLAKAIEVNEKSAQKDKKEDKRRDSLIIKLKLERQMIINDLITEHLREMFQTREDLLVDEAIWGKEFSANDMADLIQEYFIDPLQAKEDDQPMPAEIVSAGLMDYPVMDLLKAAKDVETRLRNEATRQ